MRAVLIGLVLALAGASALAASPAPLAPEAAVAKPQSQTEANAYTRYELLEPGSGKFRILYEVTATTPGAIAYYNPIRPGSVATDERVIDQATGKPLAFAVVSGKDARAQGLADAELTTDYIRVALARPVPRDGGEGRILIEKTYEDRKSYQAAGGPDITFERPLGIKRNAVVLPAGYELVACNYPSQVLQEADGRIAVSFWNATPAEAPLKLRARKVTPFGAWLAKPAANHALEERAHQTRDIVYILQAPETHKFALYHDYTEQRAGVSQYVNVVRDGSHVEAPSATNLDTGGMLRFKVIKGDDIAKANLDAEDRPAKLTAQSEVVVFYFTPVPAGGSTRLRMSETYMDPDSYKMVGDELVLHRSFGRAADAVVLPAGWMLTNSTIPGTITETNDGRVRLDFVNPRNDEIDVYITARRR